MSEVHNLLTTAKEEFAKHRVNKAVAALISAVELLAGAEAPADAKPAKETLTEPAPAPDKAKEPLAETTPADLARVMSTATLGETEEPAAKPKAKKPPVGTRSSDV